MVTDNRDSVNPAVPDTYTVSARGSSLLIHSPQDPSGTEKPPEIGRIVSTTVEFRGGTTPQPVDPSPGSPTCTPPAPPLPDPPISPPKELHQPTPGVLTVQPDPVGATEIETVVQKLCPGSGEFLFSTDDLREGGTDVVLANSGIDMAKLAPGQPLIASVKIVDDPLGPPGAKKLGAVSGVVSDQGEGGADDPSTGQGDLARRMGFRP